eukprot:PhM_4_TR9074/c0_g1_i1/m.56419
MNHHQSSTSSAYANLSVEELIQLSERKMSGGEFREAVEIQLQCIALTENLHGKKHPSAVSMHYQLASTCLELAERHLASHMTDDATRYLLHVDSLSQDAVDDAVLDRSRLLLRARLLNMYTRLRSSQGKHRQALDYAKKYIELTQRLCLLLEAPQAYLNVCAVLSALKLHDDALAYAFLALQSINRVLAAIEAPHRTTPETIALKMSKADEIGDKAAAYHCFEVLLQVGDAETTIESLLDNESLDVHHHNEAHSGRIRRPNLNLFATALRGHEPSTIPALTFVFHELAVSGSSDGNFIPTKELRSKWGGLLAMVYHSIGTQQEHLHKYTDCIKTYRVAHSTSVQYLGIAHELTQRCHATYQQAQKDASRREILDGVHMNSSRGSNNNNNSTRGGASSRMSLSRASILNTTSTVNRNNIAKRQEREREQQLLKKKQQSANTTAQDSSFFKSFGNVSPVSMDNSTGSSPPMRPPATAPQMARPRSLPALDTTVETSNMPSTSQSKQRPLWNAWHTSKDGPPRHLVLAQERQELRNKLRLPQTREALRSRCEAFELTRPSTTKPPDDDRSPDDGEDDDDEDDLDGDFDMRSRSMTTASTRPVTRQTHNVSRGKTPSTAAGVGIRSSLLMSESELSQLDRNGEVPLNPPDFVWNAHATTENPRSTLDHIRRVDAVRKAHDRWMKQIHNMPLPPRKQQNPRTSSGGLSETQQPSARLGVFAALADMGSHDGSPGANVTFSEGAPSFLEGMNEDEDDVPLTDADIAFLRETYKLPIKVNRPVRKTDTEKMLDDFERFHKRELEEARRMAMEIGL